MFFACNFSRISLNFPFLTSLTAEVCLVSKFVMPQRSYEMKRDQTWSTIPVCYFLAFGNVLLIVLKETNDLGFQLSPQPAFLTCSALSFCKNRVREGADYSAAPEEQPALESREAMEGKKVWVADCQCGTGD